MTKEHLHFVTGRLAEAALRRRLVALSAAHEFTYTLDVLPITVAALMTTTWVARHIRVPEVATRVVLPGYCSGDLQVLQASLPVGQQCVFERGPRDLRQLDQFFGAAQTPAGLDDYDIQIIAEINHVPRKSLVEVLREAESLRDDGADLIDVGCEPGVTWSGVGECVRALREAGHRVSIDSFNPVEIEAAVKAGAELVLSVNSQNRQAAAAWGCEVVVIPDDPAELPTGNWQQLPSIPFFDTIQFLAEARVPMRLDPILEPIGCGFAGSLGRYLETRRHFPDAEIMMGIGNLTELTDVDSAGVNVMLLGFCQELGIRSVLTTQVISWARSSVRECDLARRLVHYSLTQNVPPKNIEPRLVALRDPYHPSVFGPKQLEEIASQIRDNNFRIYAESGELHLLSRQQHLSDADPFVLFEKLLEGGQHGPAIGVDASHAFYLGYEMAKAVTALTLGKDYRQDEALGWGHLTLREESHRKRRSAARLQSPADELKEAQETQTQDPQTQDPQTRAEQRKDGGV